MSASEALHKTRIYANQRAAANRCGMWALIVPPVLFAPARSPDFKFNDIVGFVEGSFHDGYIGAFGHFLIVVMAWMYWAAFAACARLYNAVRCDLRKRNIQAEPHETEEYLLRPPLCSRHPMEHGCLAWLAPLSPPLVPLVVYLVFLWNYFQFYAEGRYEQRLADLLLGKSDQLGFHAVWDRAMPTMPWINAPWQTWLGMAGVPVLMFFVYSVYQMMRRYKGPIAGPGTTTGDVEAGPSPTDSHRESPFSHIFPSVAFKNFRSKAMKNVVWAVAVIVVAILAYTIYWHWFSLRQIDLPLVEPAANPLAAIGHAFPARESQIVVTARLPFATIRDLAERAIPSGIHNEMSICDSGGFSGIVASPNLSRDALNLNPEVNSAPPKVQLALQLHGTVGARAFKWIIVNFGFGTLKTKMLPELSGTVDVAANIHGWIAPGIDPHWNLTHQEHLDISVSQAEIKVLGIPIPFKDKVQEVVNQLAPGVIKGALDSISTRLAIRREVERAWKQLFHPLKISSHPDAYAQLIPEAVRLQRLAFVDANYLTVRVAVDGQLETAILAHPPMGQAPTPLPDLAIDPTISPKFHVLLPVGLDLSEINAALQNQFGEQRIELSENMAVVVSNPSVYSKFGALYVKVDIDAENMGLLRRVVGTIFLKCGLNYDPRIQQLWLTDLDFSIETKGVLTKLAVWVLNGAICRRLLRLALTVRQSLTLAERRFGESGWNGWPARRGG